MNKNKITIIFILLSFLILHSECIAKEKAKITIKLATIAPKDSTDVFEKLKAEVRMKTNNEVALKVYYGGIQGDEFNVLRKIKFEQLHGGFLTAHGLSKIVTEVDLLQLPYLYQNRMESKYIRKQLEGTFNQIFEKKGYVVLGWHELGMVYFFSKVPIDSITTARNQKWWMRDGDLLYKELFKNLGITPISLSMTDVLASMSTKLINVAANPALGAVAFRWYTRFDYMSEFPICPGVMALVVKKNIWNQISPEYQSDIKMIAKRLLYEEDQSREISNDKCLRILMKNGISVVSIDKQKSWIENLNTAAEQTREHFVGINYSKKLLDRIYLLLDEYRRTNSESQVRPLELSRMN